MIGRGVEDASQKFYEHLRCDRADGSSQQRAAEEYEQGFRSNKGAYLPWLRPDGRHDRKASTPVEHAESEDEFGGARRQSVA